MLVSTSSIQENLQSIGERLASHPKWEALCDGLEGSKRTLVALLLENQYKHFLELGRDPDQLLETTKVLNIGNFDKYAFPLIRAVYPNLVSSEIVSVQPMAGPVSLVFYMDFLAGTTKGDVTVGDALFDARTGPKHVENYSTNLVPNEVLTISSNNAVGATAGKLAYAPIKPGTFKAQVTYANGTAVIGDDGAGGMIILSYTGTIPTISAGTLDYSDGALTLDFTSNISAGTASYRYDFEASDTVMQVDMQLTSSSVEAKERKLKARHSLKAAQDLQALHGLDAAAELGAALAQFIRFEVDREVINDIYTGAGAGSATWDKTVPFGVPWEDHKKSIVDTFILNSSQVFRSTKRANTNWIVAGLQVCNVIESLATVNLFTPIPGALKTQGNAGVVKIGELAGRWTVYKDPYLPETKWVTGFKGDGFLDTGYVYAPYIPLYNTPQVLLDDFMVRQGIGTQYGVKFVNSLMYATGQMVQS